MAVEFQQPFLLIPLALSFLSIRLTLNICLITLFSHKLFRSRGKRRLIMKLIKLALLMLISGSYVEPSYAEDLMLAKVCPVLMQEQQIGILTLSIPWYHNGRENASYIAADNATGIGVEIHYFNNHRGVKFKEQGICDRFGLLQVRETNALLDKNELSIQLDIPDFFDSPFYDHPPLEHGRGMHLTPKDSHDKPWPGPGQVQRASTVAIYDTPYISDSYGIEGEHIRVSFETCLVCEKDLQSDRLLSCENWGYQRDYMGGMTGWSEPEVLNNRCTDQPSANFVSALEYRVQEHYPYWFSWR